MAPRRSTIVDLSTRDVIAAEGGKYRLTIAAVIRILPHKLPGFVRHCYRETLRARQPRLARIASLRASLPVRGPCQSRYDSQRGAFEPEGFHQKTHRLPWRRTSTKMSRSRPDLLDIGLYVFQAIVLYIVVDLIVGGAIEDALVGALSPVIGPGRRGRAVSDAACEKTPRERDTSRPGSVSRMAMMRDHVWAFRLSSALSCVLEFVLLR